MHLELFISRLIQEAHLDFKLAIDIREKVGMEVQPAHLTMSSDTTSAKNRNLTVTPMFLLG